MIARVHLEDVYLTDCRPELSKKLDVFVADLDQNHITFRARDNFVIELSYNTDEEIKRRLLDFMKGRNVSLHAVSIRDPKSGTYYNTIVSGVLTDFDFPESPPRSGEIRVEVSLYSRGAG